MSSASKGSWPAARHLCLNRYILFFFFGCVGFSLPRAGFLSLRGLLFVAVHGLLIAVASLVTEHGL